MMKVKNNKTRVRYGYWGINKAHSLPKRSALNKKGE